MVLVYPTKLVKLTIPILPESFLLKSQSTKLNPQIFILTLKEITELINPPQ